MKVSNLSKLFNDSVVFENISIEFEKNKVYSIFGKNGVGKTTLLNIMSKNLTPTSGNIVCETGDLLFIEEARLPFEFMTANEFIDMTFKFKKKSYSIEEREELYSNLLLNEPTKMIKDYSKGMKSKLLIIIALLSHPDILLLDEPFADIDIQSFKTISEALREQLDKMTLILSTHVPSIAFQISDFIVYMENYNAVVFENNFRDSKELEDFISHKMNHTKNCDK